jgi:hypothetical protein
MQGQGQRHRGLFLLLRDWLFEELGPPSMWTAMLSVVEWEHLTDDHKEVHRTMRESWLSSYSKASHTALQHWLWRFFKKQTDSFAPLHQVFSKIKVASPDSGTSAWTEIFLLCLCCWERTGLFLRRALHLEGCCFRFCLSLRLCLEGEINLSSLPDVLAILFEILIPFLLLRDI